MHLSLSIGPRGKRALPVCFLLIFGWFSLYVLLHFPASAIILSAQFSKRNTTPEAVNPEFSLSVFPLESRPRPLVHSPDVRLSFPLTLILSRASCFLRAWFAASLGRGGAANSFVRFERRSKAGGRRANDGRPSSPANFPNEAESPPRPAWRAALPLVSLAVVLPDIPRVHLVRGTPIFWGRWECYMSFSFLPHPSLGGKHLRKLSQRGDKGGTFLELLHVRKRPSMLCSRAAGSDRESQSEIVFRLHPKPLVPCLSASRAAVRSL